MLWTRAESNLAPESWQGTAATGGQATSVNLVAREDRDLGDEETTAPSPRQRGAPAASQDVPPTPKRSARKREEEDDAARAEQPPARVRRVYVKPSHNEPFLGTCPVCEVEYVSGQQVCHCCGFDELPIDESGKLKFQPNRKTLLLERRMEKLNQFGIFGNINQTLLSALTDREAAELRSVIGKRGLTSVEGSVLQDAKDKLRRAKQMGYEGVEDRYASDAQFCDRVHQEGKGVQDCIRCDFLAFAHLPDPSRTRKQISAGVAANAEHDHLLTKLIYIDHPHGLQGFPPEFRYLEKEWAFMFGRHLMSEAEFLTYLQKPRTHRGLLTWNGVIQIPALGEHGAGTTYLEGVYEAHRGLLTWNGVIQIPALGEHGAGTTYLEGVYEANLEKIRKNIDAKKEQSIAAKEANKKRKADEEENPPGASASSSGQPAAPADDATGDQAAMSQNPASWLGDTAKASAPPPEPAGPPPARGSGSARADAPQQSWSWNRDYYGSTREWSHWRGQWYFRDGGRQGRWILWRRGMAMALALSGGLGIIHREMSIKEQAVKVQRVKMYHSGFILNPACLAPKHTVEMAIKLQNQLGCSGIPVTENGRVGGRLVGLVTKRDVEDMPRTAQLHSVMNRDVVFAQEPVTLKEAHLAMQQAKVAKLPVLNKDMELVALICRGDMKEVNKYPNASRDANRQLMVGASVTAHEPDAWQRVQAGNS
eukprot:s3580_g4.t1